MSTIEEKEETENTECVSFNIFSTALLNNYYYWYTPKKKRLPVDKYGDPKTGYVYGVDWVWAEEIDQYESVSKYIFSKNSFGNISNISHIFL